jgi:outer membrane receptor for ferrienterochelin and colicins
LENNQQYIQDYAGFYIADIKATSKLTLRQGIRFIYNSRYGAPVIPSINIKYDLTSDLAFRASYAQGFRAPSLKELSLFFVDVNHNIKGNENLSAETSNNYNASLSYAKKYKQIGFKIEPTVFYNDIKNMISLAIVDPATQLYNYINIDEYKTRGVTINTDFNYKNVSLAFGYSYTGRYNSLSKSAPLPEYTYSNEYRSNVSYSLKKAGIDMGLFYKYNGALPGYALNADNSVYQTKIAAYSMLDGSISKSFWKGHVQLSGGVKNILNVQSINYNSTASVHSSGSGSMAVGMGRVYFIGMKINVWKS